jgi:meso-butanediol dehydrogenase/(S,S)-butanediol dehydrogenase/diacetyl reductase
MVLADVDLSGARSVAEEVTAAGGTAAAIAFDAGSMESCRHSVDASVEAMGRLDAVASVAGILQRSRFEDCRASDWDRVFAINVTAQFHLIQQALPHLVLSRGNVVLMASASGLRGVAYSAIYSASKHAVVGLARSLSAEFRERHVRVNAVCPGLIDTPFTDRLGSSQGLPAGKPSVGAGQPEDVAAVVAYLASEEARFVNGAAWAVDGGATAA